jgi:hypothetical protein
MENLKNWTEVTKGLYRYVIGANACYELHILYHSKDTDILTAKASLFIAGDWSSRNNANFFERECLLAEKPLFECIKKAIKDNEENNN